MISWCWNLRRQKEESKKNYKGRASFHLFCEKQRGESMREKRNLEERERRNLEERERINIIVVGIIF